MITSRNIIIFFSIIILFTQSACNALKPKKVSAKDFPPDPNLRVKKNIEEGRGFRLFDGKGKGTSYEFASSNPLWQATLDTLDFMPLVSANYSGGIIITDWYSNNVNSNESIKITIRFLTNEIRSDAVDIKIYNKKCSNNLLNCEIIRTDGVLVTELKRKILKNAAMLKEEKEKEKKGKKTN